MKALRIYAGEKALQHLQEHGLKPQDVQLIPAAAGGPKGLILHHLDRQLFGEWLPQGQHAVHLVGASIGAWRMATALMADPQKALICLPRATSINTTSQNPDENYHRHARSAKAFRRRWKACSGQNCSPYCNTRVIACMC